MNRPILAKYRTYGELYRGLCTVTGEIPIAIYRTERRKPTTPKNQNEVRLVFAIFRLFLKLEIFMFCIRI